MKIGITNDVSVAREAIRRVVVSVPGHEVIWTAVDGAEAVRRNAQEKPDLIIMDLFMPICDGVEATRRIMQESPCPILIVTSTVGGHLSKVYEAMGHGALDAVDTPIFGRNQELLETQPLLRKLETIGKLLGLGKQAVNHFAKVSTFEAARRSETLVTIGASTGGPSAMAEILESFPKDRKTTLLLVQHIDSTLAPGLADWISERTGLRVRIAKSGQRIEVGDCLLSGTNDHMILKPDRILDYSFEPQELNYRPSINCFFESVEKHWPDPGVAILLTGMGGDGATGLLGLRKAGWTTIAQDEATSVVYGMPKEAARIGAASSILPVGQIGPTILKEIARLKRSETDE